MFPTTTRLASLLPLLSLLFRLSTAFPTGGTEHRCGVLTPGHGTEQMGGTYRLTVSDTKVAPGGVIRVIIEGGDFKGFMLQARDNRGNPVGRMIPSSRMKTRCDGTGVTHSDNMVKNSNDRSSHPGTEFRWRAPANIKDGTRVMILGSIVESYERYYMVNSVEMTVGVRPTSFKPTVPVKPQPQPLLQPPPQPQPQPQPRTGPNFGASPLGTRGQGSSSNTVRNDEPRTATGPASAVREGASTDASAPSPDDRRQRIVELGQVTRQDLQRAWMAFLTLIFKGTFSLPLA